MPLKSNAIVHLRGAVARVGDWRPDIRFNETTGTYFRGLAAISPPDRRSHYRDVLSADPKVRAAADDWLSKTSRALVDAAHVGVAEHLRRRLPLERDSVGGEGDARRPDAARRGSGAVPRAGQRVVNDPAVDVRFAVAEHPAAGAAARLDSEPFKAIEAAEQPDLQRRRRCRR